MKLDAEKNAPTHREIDRDNKWKEIELPTVLRHADIGYISFSFWNIFLLFFCSFILYLLGFGCSSLSSWPCFSVGQLLLITNFQIKFIWLINFAYYTTNKAINSPAKKNHENLTTNSQIATFNDTITRALTKSRSFIHKNAPKC